VFCRSCNQSLRRRESMLVCPSCVTYFYNIVDASGTALMDVAGGTLKPQPVCPVMYLTTEDELGALPFLQPRSESPRVNACVSQLYHLLL